MLLCGYRSSIGHQGPTLFETCSIMKFLLENGATTEYTHRNLQQIVLHWAVEDGKVAVVERLLQYGANVMAAIT
jgi:ankyrin repeat protein